MDPNGFVAQGYNNPNQPPGFKPAGAQNGAWAWSGSQWVWDSASTVPTPAAKKQVSGANYQPTGVVGGPGTVTPERSAFTPEPQGPNPFGNEVPPANLSYTPFGLGGSGGGGFGGVSAFTSPFARQSDRLAPNLDQMRMQRMTQMYRYGGG